MRFTRIPALLCAMSVLVACAMQAQLEVMDSVAQPFERGMLSAPDGGLDSTLGERELLEPRQAANATATASAAVSTATGSVPDGGNATITEPTCSMTNHLSENQQASWGQGLINTCCGFATGTQCWYRNQATVAADLECTIPSCSDLESENPSLMAGFAPLNSTNGSGKYGNIFLSLGQLSPAAALTPVAALPLALTLAAVSLVTLL